MFEIFSGAGTVNHPTDSLMNEYIFIPFIPFIPLSPFLTVIRNQQYLRNFLDLFDRFHDLLRYAMKGGNNELFP